MTPDRRRHLQLTIATALFAFAMAAFWQADWAADRQYETLRGCWPDKVLSNGELVVTSRFWEREVAARTMNPVKTFFFARMNHGLHLWIIILSALIGWSGRTFRAVMIADTDPGPSASNAVPSWGAFSSTLFLSVISSGVIFVALLQRDMTLGASYTNCISRKDGYVAAVASLAAGLFIVHFMDAFQKWAAKVFDRFGGNDAK